MLKKIVIEKLIESSLSMKAWFVDGDVSINKPFKTIFRELYDEWYRNGEFEYTKGGVVKPPNYVLQIQWIVEAWAEIGSEIIKKYSKHAVLQRVTSTKSTV